MLLISFFRREDWNPKGAITMKASIGFYKRNSKCIASDNLWNLLEFKIDVLDYNLRINWSTSIYRNYTSQKKNMVTWNLLYNKLIIDH